MCQLVILCSGCPGAVTGQQAPGSPPQGLGLFFPPTRRMKRGELFDYLTEKVTLSEKETR